MQKTYTDIRYGCTLSSDTESDTKLLTEKAAAQSEAALSYHIVRGLYLLAVIFTTTITKY